ncbi:UNVERIFIED_CONTAM: hypothetical protein GTU68_041798 [Idotea baltica]|nr:hypothetical protein [Idotea baltica]
MKRGADRNLIEIEVHDLRDYGLGRHRQIDDMQYGGGAGMVMMIEPLAKCIEALKLKRNYDHIIYMTPDGTTYTQGLANQLSLGDNYMLICGHYKGIDERVRERFVTMEISIGDYVLSGGEIAAAAVVDSIGRIIPGVINDGSSALMDSHQDGLLAPPVYTRPETFQDMSVPKILLSGHTAKIEEWRSEQAYERTKNRRPDLLV